MNAAQRAELRALLSDDDVDSYDVAVAAIDACPGLLDALERVELRVKELEAQLGCPCSDCGSTEVLGTCMPCFKRVQFPKMDVFRAQAAAAEARLTSAEAVLRNIEWSGSRGWGPPCCPECDGFTTDAKRHGDYAGGYKAIDNRLGHTNDCALSKLLDGEGSGTT